MIYFIKTKQQMCMIKNFTSAARTSMHAIQALYGQKSSHQLPIIWLLLWLPPPTYLTAGLSIVTMAPGRVMATEEINSKVDVCEKAKHHTELFW